MGLLDLFRKKRNEDIQSRATGLNGYGVAVSTLGQSAIAAKESEIMSVATALRCMSVVADTVATLSGNIYMDGEVAKIMPNHPMKSLWFNKPNDHYNAFQLKRQLILNYQNLGNGYAIGMRDNRGRIISWHLRRYLRIVIYEGMKYYYDNETGDIFDADDVIHMANIGHNPYVGISKIANYALLFGKSKASLEYVNKMYANNMFLGGVIQYPESIKLTKEKALEIADLTSARYGGLENAGKLMALDQGAILKQFENGMPLSDAEYVMSERLTNEDICRIYGVPPFMTFDYAKMSGESMEAAKITFVESTILPIVTNLEQEIRNKAFKYEPKLYIKHEIKSLLRADIKSQAEYWSKMASIGKYTINELRAMDDDPPVEGGDVPLIQVNNYFPLNKLNEYAEALIKSKQSQIDQKGQL
jgi:HK97 family phage portal protein